MLEECHWQRSCSSEAVVFKNFLCDWIQIGEVLVQVPVSQPYMASLPGGNGSSCVIHSAGLAV